MHLLSALIIATAVSGCLSQMALPANSYSHEVAKYGESLVLPCNIVREGTLEKRLVQWRFYEVGSNQASTIYKDGDVLDTFQVSYSRGNINDSGSDSIIIKNLKHENCGKYVCSTIDGSPVIHNEVQVGAGELFCDSASTYANIGDFIELKCEANISANPGLRPTFQWGTYNTNLGQGSVEKKPSTGGPTKFISTYSLVAQTNTGPGYYCDLGFKYAGPVYDFASDSHKHVDTSSTYVYITMESNNNGSINGSEFYYYASGLNESGPGLNETESESFEIIYDRRYLKFEISGTNDTLASLPIFPGRNEFMKPQQMDYQAENGRYSPQYRVIAELDEFVKVQVTYSYENGTVPDMDLLRLKHGQVFRGRGWKTEGSNVEENIAYIKWEKP